MAVPDAISSLQAGGSAAGAEGINIAYEIAERYFISGGNNRIILAADGDLIFLLHDKNVFIRTLDV